jgi:formylglycine-generating enzyme required for sulfatase activity
MDKKWQGQNRNDSSFANPSSGLSFTLLSLPECVRIPEGEFLMGCQQGREDEKPVHRVWVDGFAMGIFAVTNQDYLQFIQDTTSVASYRGSQSVDGHPGSEDAAVSKPSSYADERFDHPRQPVVGVSWFEATAYCSWLSIKSGQSFRLPTEAEWERAVRGGEEGRLYAWGDEDPGTLEVYRTGWRDERPQPVGLLKPNPYGLYNIGDNVHEWCLDWYAPDFYKNSPYRNPVNLTATSRRASRGGSWRHHVKASRCAARSSLDPSFRYTDYGFRVVRVRG